MAHLGAGATSATGETEAIGVVVGAGEAGATDTCTDGVGNAGEVAEQAARATAASVIVVARVNEVLDRITVSLLDMA